MFKWIKRKLRKVVPHKPSELAQEILDALEHDEWEGDKYSITHKASGMVLWMSNRTEQHTYFHIYHLPRSLYGMKVPEDDLKQMLKGEDKIVVAEAAFKMYDKLMGTLNSTTLNALRLARQTTEIQP